MLPDVLEDRGQQLVASLSVTREEQNEIEVATRGQSGNPRWMEERRYRLTASNYGKVGKRHAPPAPLVREMLYGVPPRGLALSWGTDHEPVAIQAYEELTGCTVQPCGLFVDMDKGFLAASPDGLVGDDKIIEVKCPYKARNMTPENAGAVFGVKFCSQLVNGKLQLNTNDNYYYQVL